MAAAAMTRFELHSYIEKFAQLSSLGLNANLHFDSYNGNKRGLSCAKLSQQSTSFLGSMEQFFFLVWIVDGFIVELLNCWIVELLIC